MIPDNKFYMWRTLFGLVHADDVVADEELVFMQNVLQNVGFSEEQKETLTQDMSVAQDPVVMFQKIDNPDSQSICLDLAYDLVMVDGEYHEKEYVVMQDLQKIYDHNTGKVVEDIDAIIEKRQETRAKNYEEVIDKFKQSA